MTRLVDTNVLVDETIEDSERHLKACKLVDSSQRALLPRVVLLEYVWVMLKRVRAPSDFVAKKLEEYYLKFTPYCERLADMELALSMMSEDGAPPNQFNDYLILACARNNRAELVTFDAELAEMADGRGVRCAEPLKQ